MGAEMPKTNKFLKYTIITILIMLVILIGLTIAMIVLTATQGGPPDDMCSYMPPGMVFSCRELFDFSYQVKRPAFSRFYYSYR